MRVTIGMPFFNNEHTLVDALRSVFAQTFQDWKLILIDDGSTDNSYQLAKSVDDPRVRVISDGRNLGLPARLNQLADLAEGEFLARMDADDMMHPDRLMQQVNYFETHPQTDLVGTGFYPIDFANRVIGIRDCGPLATQPEAIFRQALFSHMTVMGRTAWWRANRYCEAYRRAQDVELWCRTFSEKRTVYGKIMQPLFYVREGGPATLQKVLQSHRIRRKITRQYAPPLIGHLKTYRWILSSYFKSTAWHIAAKLGAEAYLLQVRNQVITAEQRQAAQAGMARLMQTEVPFKSNLLVAA